MATANTGRGEVVFQPFFLLLLLLLSSQQPQACFRFRCVGVAGLFFFDDQVSQRGLAGVSVVELLWPAKPSLCSGMNLLLGLTFYNSGWVGSSSVGFLLWSLLTSCWFSLFRYPQITALFYTFCKLNLFANTFTEILITSSNGRITFGAPFLLIFLKYHCRF